MSSLTGLGFRRVRIPGTYVPGYVISAVVAVGAAAFHSDLRFRNELGTLVAVFRAG